MKLYLIKPIFYNNKAIAGFIILFSLLSCNRDRNNPGYSYINDMSESIAYEYYSSNPNFKNKETAQSSVKGSIPMGFIPYNYPKTVEGQKIAGKELVNPVSSSPENIKAGKENYKIYCSMCHGETGKGDGYLVTSKKFPKDVTSLVSNYVQNKPDGELFHVITVGSVSGFMGVYSTQLKPNERWQIVTYIKTLLIKQK